MRIEVEKYLSARLPRRLAAAASLVALAVAGCGGTPPETRVHGDTLTIYTSMPRHGVAARAADAVTAGERLALRDAHGRIGKRRVRLVELDDSDPTGATWSPSVVEANARLAASDSTTIAYIGELSQGGSAVSVPVTNDADILQLSPGDGLTSLTQVDPAGFGSGPERYYSQDDRSFLRLVPSDLRQAATLVSWAASEGARSITILHDDSVFGRELADEELAAAGQAHVVVADNVAVGDDPAAYPGLAATLAQKAPGAVLYDGIGGATAGPLLAAMAVAMPHAHLYGTSSLATAAPLPPGLPNGVELVKPALPPSRYPPAGRQVLARLRRASGGPVDAEALYGYDAMTIVLDAIRRAGREGNDRLAVTRAALLPRQVTGALGAYSITGAGETSAVDFAGYQVAGAGLRFVGIRGAGPALPPTPARPPAG